ncbi:amidohydrolase [Flammeovirgaceae bacterium SG7u.111]|nr:amidohydrolase [Flammeovirgaceae bacterium SG7u.132]WPO37432.1 amidohydrolase [Flammeovirgaceae bacterium SG7u.111]
MTTSFIDQLIPRLHAIRKELHAYPEVAEQEFATAKRIENHLRENTSATVTRVAKTGVLAIFDSKVEGKTILLRADTDALPIQEVNDFTHKSTFPAISHKCGHDGHTSIMVGVAEIATKFPIKTGKLLLLFQPAEENGMGAQGVLNDSGFQQFEPDFVFALHNLPGFEKHQIVIKEKAFTANVKSIIIKLNGKTAHAAEPEKGFNPALAIAKILTYSEEQTNNFPEREDFFLVTPIYLNMGELAYGISAGYGEVHLTIRSWSNELMEENITRLLSFIDKVSEKYHLKAGIEWLQVFHANQNNAEAIAEIKKAALENQFSLNQIKHPFKWGEDFGLFTQKCKGAMFGLGAGKNMPALHNPDYDYPDEITITGIKMFHQIVSQTLGC